MGARSYFAFRFTVEEMIDNLRNGKLWFWTFTFKDVLDVDVACKRWQKFLGGWNQRGSLIEAYPHVAGVRVYEMHPGTVERPSHGLHIHAIVDCRLSVDVVRVLWHRHAGQDSRLQVEVIPPERAFYIGKYLSPSRRHPALDGKQLWAAFGICTDHRTRCKDIVIQNAWVEAYKFLSAAVKGFSRLPWPQRLRMAKDFAYGENFQVQLERYGYTLDEEFIDPTR